MTVRVISTDEEVMIARAAAGVLDAVPKGAERGKSLRFAGDYDDRTS